jgi:uncharacterized protein
VRRFCAILILVCGFRLFAQEVMPSAPTAYFNDYARVVSAGTAAQLNKTLEDFERQSSDQIVVAVFPKMQSDSSVQDYTLRIFRAWGVGQKDKNNGVALFVFVQDHKLFLQVGYGLEGVLPDALGKRIIDEQITPRFKAGDFDGGLSAGVSAILAATKGEYKGNGTTVAQGRAGNSGGGSAVMSIFLIIVVLFIVLPLLSRASRSGGIMYRGGGWSGGSSSGRWNSGGGFGGGFGGGGGSCGGGGAGGSW